MSGRRATWVAPKVSEFNSGGADHLKFDIRVHHLRVIVWHQLGTNLGTQTKWFRGYAELIRGHRAARVVPKVSEFDGAGAESLKSHIRIHQKHTYIGTNRFFMFHYSRKY